MISRRAVRSDSERRPTVPGRPIRMAVAAAFTGHPPMRLICGIPF